MVSASTMADTKLDTTKFISAPPVMPVGVVDPSPPAYAEGDIRPWRIDPATGGVWVSVQAAGGAALATEAKQDAQLAKTPDLWDGPLLEPVFAWPVRVAGIAQVQVVESQTANATLGANDLGVSVRTRLDDMPLQFPAELETDGEGGGGRFKISVGNHGLENAVENPVYVTLADGEVSNENSTDVPLGIGGTFPGQFADVIRFANVSISLSTDQAGALLVEWSSDGVNVDSSDAFTIPAGGVGTVYTFNPTPRYVRVSYTNGAIAQTFLRLQTILRRTSPKPSSHGLTSDLGDYHDTELVRAILAAKKPDGTYTNIGSDNDGHLIVTNPSQAADRTHLSRGRITLGSTTPTPIRATVYTEQTANAERSIVSSNVNDTAAGTGAREVRVVYYDEDVAGPFEVTVATDGTTPVDLGVTNMCFIESMDVPLGSTGSANANLGVISLKAATAGGGATIWSIAIGDNTTLGAHHYVATGATARITGISCGIKGLDAGGFEIRLSLPTSASPGATRVISDQVRVPDGGYSFRSYISPIEVEGPALFTVYIVADSTSNRTYHAAVDHYENLVSV